MSSVVVSRVGVGGGEPLHSFSRGILSTVREGVELLGIGNTSGYTLPTPWLLQLQ